MMGSDFKYLLKICRCENKDKNQISVTIISSQITESKTDYSSHSR